MKIKKNVANIVHRILKKLGIGAIRRNVNKTQYDKNLLFSYIKGPFEGKTNSFHQNAIQALEIARIIGGLGYNVDVIDFNSAKVHFDKMYDALFEIQIKEHPIYERNIKGDAKRIVYMTGSNPTFSNEAEKRRLKELEQRRGVKLQPRRQVPRYPKELEKYDELVIIGNDYNLSTYEDEFILPPCFSVHNTGYDFIYEFDPKRKRKDCFLYFGSSGCVHKGLDLLLDIFSEKDFPAELFVCGSYEKEEDFYKEYKNELTKFKNIHPIGFVDIKSDVFEEISNICCFTILPSCSEARAGAVVACMSKGLIPICSKECGYDADEAIVLENCEISTIRGKILEVSNWNIEDITVESRKTYELVRERFNITKFSEEMEYALRQVL
ncbi:glycosyltransferase [Butyrivibrio sp. INlla16]|uniref:glycosyltransferase n=1 Tax=Butyrivibrio sp. INlla16 TaxID=1520807 RepID=UPI00088EFF98|nr:glycosyltransferase [Butyrivibrio sp. INlla16]SDB68199.1 Glycosyltransferase involved in cell wall bisynthesis [Butyrivibrio sp. INlla16]